jgi:hypothetical protein
MSARLFGWVQGVYRRLRPLRRFLIIASEWIPPRAYFRHFAMLLVGFSLLGVAFMNGLVWFTVPHWISFLARGVIGPPVIAVLVVTYFRLWLRNHSTSLPLTATLEDQRFAVLSATEKRQLLEDRRRNRSFDLQSQEHMLADLISPGDHRTRAVERIQVLGRTGHQQVTFELDPAATFMLDGWGAVLLTRPLKGQHLYTDFRISGPADRQLALLPFVETAALLYELCLVAAQGLADVPLAMKSTIEQQLAEVILDPTPEEFAVAYLYIAILKNSPNVADAPDAQRSELFNLLTIVGNRRPMYACETGVGNRREPTPLERVSFEYDVRLRSRYEYQFSYDWWRRRKDQMRQWLLFPPRLILLPIERARSSSAYRLHVTSPPGLYIDEAAVYNDGENSETQGWLPNLPRESMHRSYLGWQEPSGTGRISLGAVSFSNTTYRRPLFCLRLMEIPPGSLGGATVVAIAVIITTWLCGALTPTGTKDNVDVVAFIIAFPGVFSSWLGLAGGHADRAYRSLTAFLSLTTSAGLSLVALIIYLGRHAGDPHIGVTALPDGKTVVFIHDWLWIALLAAALVNFIGTGGTLLMRVVRYRRQLLRGTAQALNSDVEND